MNSLLLLQRQFNDRMDKIVKSFDGSSYQPELDFVRLETQYHKVLSLMLDGKWRTLHEISQKLNIQNFSSISARLGDFRKEKNGAHTVEKRRRGNPENGLFEYKLIVNIRNK